jgi:hypothetical protein
MTIIADIDISRALAAAAKRPRVAGVPPKARWEALAMIEEEALVAPTCSYGNRRVRDVRGAWLDFGEATLHAPGLSAVSEKLSGVTAIACTLGPALEARVSTLCAGRRLSLALALDEVGNELLMYIARLVALKIRGEARQHGLSVGETLTPGGRGLALDQQEAVLSMAGGERIGITVTEQGMLFPVKSRSMVVAIGKGLSAQPLRKRCEKCSSREQCRYRSR